MRSYTATFEFNAGGFEGDEILHLTIGGWNLGLSPAMEEEAAAAVAAAVLMIDS